MIKLGLNFFQTKYLFECIKWGKKTKRSTTKVAFISVDRGQSKLSVNQKLFVKRQRGENFPSLNYML